MALLLRLPHHGNYEQAVDRDRLVQLFPESLFATTLELDPTIEMMEIQNPDVTPTTLNYLATVVSTGTLPPLPPDVDSRILERYFLVRVFGPVGEQNYDFLIKGRNINLLDVKTLQNPQVYYQLLMDGFALQMPALLDYLLAVVPQDTNPAAEQKALIGSILTQNLPLFRQLLRRNVDPFTASVASDEFRYITQVNQITGPAFQFFRSLYRHNPVGSSLHYASGIGNQDMVTILLTNPHLHINQTLRVATLTVALQNNHHDIARLLLPEKFRFTESMNVTLNELARSDSDLLQQFYKNIDDDDFDLKNLPINTVISLAQEYVIVGNVSAVQTLLDQERNPIRRKTLAEEILFPVADCGYVNLLTQLLAVPGLRVTKIRATISPSLIGHPDIITILLQDPRSDITSVLTVLRVGIVYEHEPTMRLAMQDPRIDYTVRTKGQLPIEAVAGRNRPTALRVLLEDKRFDPSISDNVGVKLAARYGYDEVLRLLLADVRVDPLAEDNKAVLSAYDHGYPDTVKLLLTDTRVRAKLGLMQTTVKNPYLQMKYQQIAHLGG